MISDQINTTPSSTIIDSLEALFEYIDAHPIYPVNTNDLIDNRYQLLDHLEREEEYSNKQYISINQPISDNQTDLKTLSSSDLSRTSSKTPPITSTDDNDEILFDSVEWQIEDLFTKKLRPPKLYEFLRLLLNNLRYISYASWLNEDEGLFKIHKPTKVAQLWKKVKTRQSNLDMNYDKFARGIRYYYDNGTMIATHTRHTYRFAANE